MSGSGANKATWKPSAPDGIASASEGFGLRQHVSEMFEREYEQGRGFHWLPVLFGVGILCYFGLPREPSLFVIVSLSGTALVVAWLARRQSRIFRMAIALVFVALGATTIKLHTDWAYAPKVPGEMTSVLTGWVIEKSAATRGGSRLTIRVKGIERLTPEATPYNVRVTVRAGTDLISVGEAVAVTARIRPPNGPVLPGGYDFARAAYFARIGAVGFAYGAARPADLGAAPLSVRIREPLAQLRALIGKRIADVLPGDRGRVAIALITGERGGISNSTQEAMRASGLGHMLAISGLHMALIAGTAFWVIRALLALSSGLALRYPIKKWAAVGALAVASVYLGISGAHVATQRAYIMLAIMLLAVLLDRRAITLRNVALAAFVVLMISPESLLTASFQMSFAATIALVAAYEALSAWSFRRPRLTDWRAPGFLERAGRFAAGLVTTSLIAGLATMPFAIFHFQRIAPLTLLANVLAMPALVLIVMPMGFFAVLVMPLGLESFPLAAMNWGLGWIIAVAEWTSALTGESGSVRKVPVLSLILVAAGFLWLSLWRERWRLLGVFAIAAAIPIAFLSPRPDILISGDGVSAAIRDDSGRLLIIAGRGSRFAVENWLRADADSREPGDESLSEGVLCDPLGCVAKLEAEASLAVVRKADAFAEDCQLASIVVSHLDAPAGCADNAIVIDRQRLKRHGAHAFYRVADSQDMPSRFRITTAYPAIQRPWMPAFSTDE